VSKSSKVFDLTTKFVRQYFSQLHMSLSKKKVGDLPKYDSKFSNNTFFANHTCLVATPKAYLYPSLLIELEILVISLPISSIRSLHKY
jgi:hypothetical protein